MQTNNMERLIGIIGPTAVGKTNLGIELAKRLNTEIISGDSMLVYHGFDIGTAKPTLEEQAGIVHHLINILEPTEEFNVTKFKQLASNHIELINQKGKIPILVGGTGLYIKSLVEDYQFNETPGDEAYRMELEEIAKVNGKEYVHTMLQKVDPKSAERLHVNDFRRVIRALEVYHIGGENISQEKNMETLVFDAKIIGLTMERSKLYERINKRVDLMIEAGLVKEIEMLLNQGVDPACQAMKGIGYKEITSYLQGEVTLDFAIDTIKKSTRHFAKRQLTWFRKMPYIDWYDVDQIGFENIVENVYKQIAGKYSLR
ncbi:MAG: tRNA dimethylallyltransferase [Massilibacillus sp.]|jgi:tRNA dimethylallyltransferase|nr:tRNA dimethylallyltransferase [Massilibacillus sp.]